MRDLRSIRVLERGWLCASSWRGPNHFGKIAVDIAWSPRAFCNGLHDVSSSDRCFS